MLLGRGVKGSEEGDVQVIVDAVRACKEVIAEPENEDQPIPIRTSGWMRVPESRTYSAASSA